MCCLEFEPSFFAGSVLWPYRFASFQSLKGSNRIALPLTPANPTQKTVFLSKQFSKLPQPQSVSVKSLSVRKEVTDQKLTEISSPAAINSQVDLSVAHDFASFTEVRNRRKLRLVETPEVMMLASSSTADSVEDLETPLVSGTDVTPLLVSLKPDPIIPSTASTCPSNGSTSPVGIVNRNPWNKTNFNKMEAAAYRKRIEFLPPCEVTSGGFKNNNEKVCFVNASLQALFACSRFKDFLTTSENLNSPLLKAVSLVQRLRFTETLRTSLIFHEFFPAIAKVQEGDVCEVLEAILSKILTFQKNEIGLAVDVLPCPETSDADLASILSDYKPRNSFFAVAIERISMDGKINRCSIKIPSKIEISGKFYKVCSSINWKNNHFTCIDHQRDILINDETVIDDHRFEHDHLGVAWILQIIENS
jgi:hypothetical protein